MKREIERRLTYGHSVSKRSIVRKYPLDDYELDYEIARNKKFTVTFDMLLAYELREKGYGVIAWGAICRGKRIFVFDKPQKKVPLPF